MPVAHLPCPPDGTSLSLPDGEVDLRARALVAGVVPAPRFGRENEVVATVAAVAARGADLVDVSLGPRLIGPAAQAGIAPVVSSPSTLDAARHARRAGAAVVLLPLEVAGAADRADVAAEPDDRPGADASALIVGSVAVRVGRLDDLASGRAVAERLGVPLAFDSTAMAPEVALAAEAVAVVDGCRLLRTADVRRARRLVTVVAALWEARRG